MTLQQDVDKNAILSEEQIALIVERVLAALKGDAMRVRDAKLADLRGWEDMHNLPRSIPTVRERSSTDRGGRAQLLGPHRGRNKT